MNRKVLVVFAATAVLAACSLTAAERTVLAVPAQHTLVNLAFDLADLLPRDLEIVCYDQPAGAPPRLEVFDRAIWRWQPLTLADWTAGALPRAGASRLVTVGDPTVAAQLQSASWVQRTQHVDGRRLHEVANAVHREARLSRAQWERLAQAYGFKLEDRNVEARRYGRYGPPGGRPVRPLPQEADPVIIKDIVDLPPLPVEQPEPVAAPPVKPVVAPPAPVDEPPPPPRPEDK